MKEEWVKRLNEKMSGFTEPAPDMPPSGRRQGVGFRWLAIGLAAAAAVAGVLVWVNRDAAPALKEEPAVAVTEPPKVVDSDMADQGPATVSAPVPSRCWTNRQTAQLTPPDVRAQEAVPEPVEDAAVPEEEDDSVGDVASSTVVQETSMEGEEPVRAYQKPIHFRVSLFAQASPFGPASSRMALGREDEGNTHFPRSTPSTPPQDTTNPPDTDNLTTPQDEGGNDDDGTKTKAPLSASQTGEPRHAEESPQHRFPIQLGLRFAVGIGGGFSIESGLSYMRFLSLSGQQEQRLHYLGVPLRLRHGIWETKTFSFYGSAGGEAFKCVAGNGPDKPWLFEGDAAVGLDWKLTPLLGLYAETGVGYYFHTGESWHYYTEHPFALNVTMGLRFDF